MRTFQSRGGGKHYRNASRGFPCPPPGPPGLVVHGMPIVQSRDVPMSPDFPPFSAVIARLRTAGCVYAEEEAALLLAAGFTAGQLAVAVERRSAGFPLEHILGWAEFCGLRIAVEAGVFVPRRRTELLVREAARILGVPLAAAEASVSTASGAPAAAPVVVDLCCGSGAVGLALAKLVPGMELHASDIDPAAVRCARRNVLPVGGTVHEGDLYSALPDQLRGRADILAVNAPYVPTQSIGCMPSEARVHEPRVSLDGGPDGLHIQRRVAGQARSWLRRGGHLLIETSRRQARGTAAAMVRGGLAPRIVRSEELDATVVVGHRP
jgi:release factor glutamine methyltransferase